MAEGWEVGRARSQRTLSTGLRFKNGLEAEMQSVGNIAPFPLLFFSFISRTGDPAFYFLRTWLQGSGSNSPLSNIQVLTDGRKIEAIIIFHSGRHVDFVRGDIA